MRKGKYLTAIISLIFMISTYSVTTSLAATLYGDVNSNNSVDAVDFAYLRQYILGMRDQIDETAADVSGDGDVNAVDFAYLRQFLLGQITKFPADKIVPTPTAEVTLTPEITPTAEPTATINPDQWKENTGTINLGSTITYTGTGISVSGSVVSITAGGDHEVKGTLTNGMIYVDTKEKVKLRLSGVNITNAAGPAICFADVDKGFITITEGTVNYLTDGSTYSDEKVKGTLFSNDDLEIKGKGTLNITGNYAHGIACDDDLSIGNGKIFIEAAKDGLSVNDKVEISGGTVYIDSKSDGIDAGKDINISGGTVIALSGKAGFTSKTALNISGGTLISTGSYTAAPSSNSTQASLYKTLSSTVDAGILFNIGLNGSDIVTFAPAKSYNQLFYSSYVLTAGTTYDINIGGSSTGKSTNGLYSGGAYTPGSTNLTAPAALIP